MLLRITYKYVMFSMFLNFVAAGFEAEAEPWLVCAAEVTNRSVTDAEEDPEVFAKHNADVPAPPIACLGKSRRGNSACAGWDNASVGLLVQCAIRPKNIMLGVVNCYYLAATHECVRVHHFANPR